MRTVLTLNQAESVCGGDEMAFAEDSRFLNSLNGSTDRYGYFTMWLDIGGGKKDEIARAWAALGVTLEYESGKSNRYFAGGRELSQERAREYAMGVAGHIMVPADWQW